MRDGIYHQQSACRPTDYALAPSESPVQAKARLSQAAEAVKTEVAKCAVMGEGVREDPLMAAPLLGGLQQKTIALCALLSEVQVGA